MTNPRLLTELDAATKETVNFRFTMMNATATLLRCEGQDGDIAEVLRYLAQLKREATILQNLIKEVK